MDAFSLRQTDIRPKSSVYWILAILVLFGLLIRVWRLTFVSVWYDEYLSIQTISLPIKNILIGDYPREINPPFYFLLLKAWNHIGGHSETQMRLLSLLFSIGAIPLMYFVTQYIGGDWRVSLGSTTLLAFHPLYIHYSVEIRMYSLMIFSTLLSIFFFLLYLRKPRIMWIIGVSSSLLILLYTQYFGILILIGLFIYVLYRLLLQKDKGMKRILFALTACLFLYLPGLYFFFLPQAKSLTMYYQNPTTTIYRVNAGIILGLLSGSGEVEFTISNVLEVFGLICAIFGIIIIYLHKKVSTAIFIVGFITICSVIAILINHLGLNIISRYLLHINLFGIIVVSFTLLHPSTGNNWEKHTNNESSRRIYLVKGANVIGMIMIIVMILSGVSKAIQKEYPYPDWRAVAAAIDHVRNPGEPLVVMGYDGSPIKYYLPNATYLSVSEVNQDLQQGDQPYSYIVIETPGGNKFPETQRALLLYKTLDNKVRVYRYSSNFDFSRKALCLNSIIIN